MAKIGSLTEIETSWNINDLADANEALDIKAEMEQSAIDEIKRG